MDHAIDPCPSSTSGVSAHLFLTLINTLLASKCRISSPSNYPPNRASTLSDNDEFDFIIVGSGTSGSVVTNQLSQNRNWKILVLESGNLPTPDSEIPSLLFSLQGTESDWQYTTEPNQNSCQGFIERKCRWPRGKCLGGSSAINANLYIRGNKRDYDKWAELGNEGWDYNSVMKYYKILENVDGFDGYGRGGYVPLNVYQSNEPVGEALKASARVLGTPTTQQEANFGYFEALQTVEKGIRANAGKIFLGQAKDRENLVVALDSTVEKILLNGKKTEGVVINIGGKQITIKARKEVILSAGAINSPKILMLSGIGPKKHLQDLGIEPIEDLQVGENLQDHIFYLGLLVAVDEKVAQVKTNVIDDIYKYFMYNEGAVGQIGITNLVGFVNSRNDSDYPNLQFHHILFIKGDNYLLPETLRVMGLGPEVASIELETNQKSPMFKIAPTLLNPKSRGKILLKSKNPHDKPLIFANYLDDPQDVEILLEGIKFGLKQIESEPFAKFQPKLIDYKLKNCQKFEFKSDDYWRCAIRWLTSTVYHPVGTCKMGPRSDPGAVLDSRLRVHGIDGLRVIDASIMPLIISGNTNAPSLMIGLKGGMMISEDWGGNHDEL
ncbi:glucose dehydrogenase [FAD, quinone]-like [Tribolium madens]|uniref:glucose dehydrogenase [FAD, quinone]-like n=1 Tax=Tribolium madens TaxID=41895 RepID=UPI001CF71E1F|nr:glucose dehydrogenase [FAD, quinone]-like [Tribolium madens]